MQPLAPTQREAWERFAGEANWMTLSTSDLERFARFVAQTHRYRRDQPIDFRELVDVHLSDDPRLAHEIATQIDALYRFGRQVCQVR